MRRVASGASPCDSVTDSSEPVIDARRQPRRELPTDAGALAPMGAAFEAALERGLEELGLSDTEAASGRARRSYERHARLLREWNASINLTAIREPAEIARRHICDSLSAVPVLTRITRPGPLVVIPAMSNMDPSCS